MKNVDSKTRAGKNGREIYCPDCNTKTLVFHFSWTAMECQQCKGAIEKSEWLTKETLAELLGKKGGQAKSEAKTRAARANAKKPRGKWATAIYYSYISEKISATRTGILLIKGKPPKDDAKFWSWANELIENDLGNWEYPVQEIMEFSTRTRLI